MHVRELPLGCEPWSLFRVLASKERPFFIDAGQPWGEEWLSCMGFRPRMQFRVTAADAAEAPLATLDARLAEVAPERRAAARRRATLGPQRVPFAGGVVAALAYEARHAIERAAPAPGEAVDAPRLAGGVYDWALSYDHRARRWRLASWHLDARALAAVAEEIRDAARDAARSARPAVLPTHASAVVAGRDADAYAARVARIREYIAAGDVYQVNLTDRFTIRLPAPPVDVYERLRATQSVPFGAYLDLGVERVLSGSPELFLRRRGERVTTCPIKGTRPRGATAAGDAALAADLARDPKERAEHVMIVDLERNDLGRVCRTGSVAVERLAAGVPFATVQHLVSTVSGRLRPAVATSDLLRATFPSGSITGAPKIRAMEIIAEIEGAPRGFYTGAVGWIDASGDCDLNVAIRTAVARGETLAYHAGGGIVADSRAEREYAELHLKAAAFFRALGIADADDTAAATRRASR
ncbi:MAG: aminodeoxychorismate synthase component I [Deltaproteobacteria bacterium]|nr:aminodeoxychorismate synthase component I [Deltaproteobacteria bacterium]